MFEATAGPAVRLPKLADEGSYQTDHLSLEADVKQDRHTVADIVCCALSDHYGALDRLWVRADYLYWWMESYSVPPLATTVPVGGGQGTVTNPNATIALGNERWDTDGRSGIRVQVGYVVCPERMLSVQADFFTLEQGGSTASLAATEETLLFRPFFDTSPGGNAPAAQRADTVDFSTTSQVVSAGVALRRPVCCRTWCCEPGKGKGCDSYALQKGIACAPCVRRGYQVDVFGGYRYFGIDESLTIGETASFPPGEPSTFFELTDQFETKNQFHGGEVGIVAQCYRGPWMLEGLLKVALGNNHEEVIIAGQRVTTSPPDAPEVNDRSLLANPNNIGRYKEDHFAAIPEFQLRLRRQVTHRLSLSFGYTFLYISDLVRPGDQIDPMSDVRWLDDNLPLPLNPPATHPEAKYERSDAWLQGMDVGLTWNY
jgi:hypothetical protein